MPRHAIKRRFTRAVLFAGEFDSFGAAIVAAVAARFHIARADLCCADLSHADLSGADLSSADLRSADLRGANMTCSKLPHFQIPDGDMIGWKKCSGRIVKLLIPSAAMRTGSLIGRKCRAEFAHVLDIDGAAEAASTLHTPTVYRVGEVVRPSYYDDDPRVECAAGIHFFQTRAEAEEYL